MKIEGKRVLITGGSSGLGFEIARAMLAGGARVVITGRDDERLKKAESDLKATGPVTGVQADVGTADSRTLSLDRALELLGGLDILINNAGGVRAGRLEKTTEREIRAMIEVDLVAPILLTQSALPYLRASENGLVVNVTSGIAAFPFMRPMRLRRQGLRASVKHCAAN